MADLADVSNLLATMALNAVFPSGTSSASATGSNVVVGRGWPLPGSLEPLLANGGANVSIFPPPGASERVFQILDEDYIIVPAVHGMTASVVMGGTGATATLSGTPGMGEYASIVADGRWVYSHTGASVSAILASIKSDAAANYSGVSVSGNSISFPTDRIVCRIGAPATIGHVTHRQKQQFMVTVWAPNPAQRDTLAQAIDVSFKSVNRLTMPDTSQAVLVYSHTNEIDERSKANIYRRDLVYTVEYATLETYTAWEVTSFTIEEFNANYPAAVPTVTFAM